MFSLQNIKLESVDWWTMQYVKNFSHVFSLQNIRLDTAMHSSKGEKFRKIF